MQASPLRSQQRSLFATAAETVASAAGVAETVAEVVQARALRHYQEALRQYLVIRLADPAAAAAAIQELGEIVAAWPPEKMLEPPGARAHLFKMARGVAYARRGTAKAPDGARAELPWRRAEAGVGTEYLTALQRVRAGLDPEEAELVELHHARELTVEEIGHVTGLPLREAAARLESALSRVEGIVGNDPPSRIPGVRGAVIEAFALQPARGPSPEVREPEKPTPLPAGTVLGGRYRIEECLGSGAFADVYRAVDKEVPAHEVALKLTRRPAQSETARAAALRELRLIASVFHPSVVHFKDHGWHRDCLWFVMPRYEGETLEKRLGRGPLSRAEARRIFEPLARALADMHAASVRHQDIKPDNIFLARLPGFGEHDLLPVLLDLGVAASDAEMLLAGTPMYFAPEVAARFASLFSGERVTPKADVFSLALALRNALEPGTQEDVAGAAVEAFVDHRANHMPALPHSRDLAYLEPAFRRWLAVDPEARPDAGQLADELAVLTAPEERRRRRAAVLRWVLPAVGVLGVAFGTAVYGLSKRAAAARQRAEAARTEAANLKADLAIADSRRQALEAGQEELHKSYVESQLTRGQMASELATAQAQLRILRESMAEAELARAGLENSVIATRDEAVRLGTDLATAQAQAAAQTERGDDLQAQLGKAREQNDELGTSLAAARARARELSEEIERLRTKIAIETAKVEDLERRLRDADRGRERAEGQPSAAEGRRRRAAGPEEEPAAAPSPAPSASANDANTPPP